MLGGVFIGEEPLPWSGPLFSHQISGERRETGQTYECCLFPRNVWRSVSLVTTILLSILSDMIL